MRITVHAGHAAMNNRGSGAAGYCAESHVDRLVTKSLINYLKLDGHEVFDCTVDSADKHAINAQNNIITKIKKNINAVSKVDYNISIHLNASKKSTKDGKTKGVECVVYSKPTVASVTGADICAAVAKLGFANRGVKTNTGLGVLKGIKNGGANILVECFFCDDEDDFMLYSRLGADRIALSIAEGIVGHSIGKKNQNEKPDTDMILGKYILNDASFGKLDLGYVFDPDYYRNVQPNDKELPLFQKMTKDEAYAHFLKFGMNEGRQANKYFNPAVYAMRYTYIKDAYGKNWANYYKHYIRFGMDEGKTGI